ncbi:pyrroline-5-carboxylate reductase [Corynebacterium sp. 153RC1]|uniref:pyrroline-5-carboxylate reductase n=1 Tax=unclassified Corynebacterium TaxID=2624378 RepID=UPI00211BC7B9|nr:MULTISPECIES: pyrroline-5-carboxylate reductase [unclassified Corynebacterium]MCQ9370532.1 pyrroline-5-carboxylate reductase [Corynebacterium sp. 35RC1]MCQ9351769.1 pyrroline-5-carboxylate reductase [Corynebacterium sp. 209RC1]MCQ9354505.1 pyrroline-5-carboxylate reductase [Corynebacterium sp. 1222RC1]MCQ9356051.1 pyrroline-5-carboxylate reductase [Corynebacterium sp. 122RC1]MCQ9358683.1 pyrroline-5-carboxylate reductase [Corynebacterium sp. 142RC1]
MTSATSLSIAILGGGKIGEALIAGLVAGGVNPKDIHVTNRTEATGQALEERYGVVPMTDNNGAASDADVVFLCVKPKQIVGLLEEVAQTIDNNANTVVVSMAAGVTNAAMEEVLAAGSPVVRVMPNTPMLVGAGMSAVAPGRFAREEDVELVTELLEKVGEVTVIEESEMDAVVALSGSAPAYYFLFTEALIDAGVSLGLPRDVAKRFAVSSAAGAGKMLAELGEEPATLRANVSSPAGTTIAALRELEESGLRGAVYRAAEACAQRNKELG